MYEILDFMEQHMLFTVLLAAANLALAAVFVKRLRLYTSAQLAEAMGGRDERMSLYSRCLMLVKQSIKDYEKRRKKAGIYLKAREKMKKSGYSGEYAAAIYLLLKYVLTALIFITAFVMNYPDISPSLVVCAGLVITIELVVAGERRKINLKFQRYIYKIYKYLHNQISSGVKVTDAIRTVYEVIEDKELKDVLIRLAARYELTLDIDAALEEFKSSFDVHEAETLCVALKQGIETGDNQELLARQEDIMFKKYFNYLQAETDSCKTRSIAAVAMFTAVVVLMIVIPLFNDVTDAVGRIFVN